MLGIFFATAVGVFGGALIVGACWSTANAKVEWAMDVAIREAQRQKADAERELIAAATRKLSGDT
jgi:hypothetical protein